MNCDEFRRSIAEHFDEALSPGQAQAFEEHRQACVLCRTTEAQWHHIAEMLRAGWPAVDPPVHQLFIPPQARSGWLETTCRWFSYASMALVATGLLLLVTFPPAVRVDRSQMTILFGAARSGVSVVSQQQVPGQTEDQKRALDQLATQLAMLTENQRSLWQTTAEQKVYLESLWSRTEEQGAGSGAVRPKP